MNSTFNFDQSLLGCKFNSWNVIKLLANLGSKVIFHNPWNNKKTYGFLMFSGGIEKEHWLHFLMSLKENIGCLEKIRI